ncbi:hypothetical protein [Nocardia bovistercoris]|uniref:Uncharacterized protein n=1 Tax=Nocardia bovistercoris TaxID=2785916 RepID=A0A931ICU9_9NOCA|nr:hypothetical protein [Nocardia bovistercoris]MBH0778796.1 hypothetical protein [Nocardia bovistercoris]
MKAQGEGQVFASEVDASLWQKFGDQYWTFGSNGWWTAEDLALRGPFKKFGPLPA